MLGSIETPPGEIAGEVELDPGLTAQVLRVVNSAHYAGDNKIVGIAPAVTRIGFKMMRRIVTVAGMMQMLGKPKEDAEVDLKAFWGHSLWVAHAASLICEERKLGDADGFFTSGLLHDVGKLVIFQHLQARLKLILQGVRQGQPFEKVETAVLGGINHAAIGSTLSEVWRLPAEVIESARHHLDDLVMLESFQISQEARVVGAVCGLHASRAPVEQVARFLKMARDPLEAVRKEAFERSIASLRELFQLM
jgi:HD-like signal output (HDOD) protein